MIKFLRLVVSAVFIIVSAVFIYSLVTGNVNTDSTVPEITIIGDVLEVALDSTEEDFLNGVTAYDGKDKDITDKIVVESVSKFTDDGICKVTYAVCDSDNHVAKATRKIKYRNYTSTRFEMTQSTCYSTYENIDVSKAIKVTDCIEGDITRNLIITSKDYTSSQTGVFTIEASVTSSRGDTARLDIPLIIEERSLSAPSIKLSEYLIYTDIGKMPDFDEYVVKVTDAYDREIDVEVKTESNIDIKRAGTYSVHYYATDDDGLQGHTVLTVVVGS